MGQTYGRTYTEQNRHLSKEIYTMFILVLTNILKCLKKKRFISQLCLCVALHSCLHQLCKIKMENKLRKLFNKYEKYKSTKQTYKEIIINRIKLTKLLAIHLFSLQIRKKQKKTLVNFC